MSRSALVIVIMSASLVLAAPAEAAPKCAPVIAIGCGLIGGAVDVAGDAAGEVIGAGAKAAGNTVLDGMAGWVGEGAAWLVTRIAKLVERSTRPELGATWFSSQYRGMLSLALLSALAFLLVALGGAALRQDLEAAVRAAFVALPLAVIACFAAVTLVELALAATNDATRVLTSRTGDDSKDFFVGLADAIKAPAGTPMPGFLSLIGGVLAALLCIVVWIELILREAAIYLSVAFLPLSLSAMVWRRTAHLARRLVEGLAAVILSKLTIAAAVAFAASALANGRSGGGGFTTLLAGCAVLFLAALSPWTLLRLIPLAGDQALHRGAVKEAVGSAPGAGTASTVVRAGMFAAFAPAAMAAAPAAAAAIAGGASQSPPTPKGPTPPLRLGQSLSAQPEQPRMPSRTGGGDA